MELMKHQIAAIEQLGNGKILYGNVGSGKSVTALGYYIQNEAFNEERLPRHIYVITTAKKRDSLDWEKEAANFGIGTDEDSTVAGIITVDSWNNIKNYKDIQDAFFIFDEQRLVGSGTWVSSFLKIAKKNRWIMLSATPGDTWMDYIPVFVANGFYKNRTWFKREHVIYAPYSKYPKVVGYLGERKLELLRNEILVEAPYVHTTERFLNYLDVGYNVEEFEKIHRSRWNVFEDRPVKDAAELWRLMRRVVNSDPSRIDTILNLMETHPKLIIFYNFDYELQILRTLNDVVFVGELNGHIHDPIPHSNRWVYLVQYVAGAEAWNCVETDAMVLYSLTYSYKNFVQAQGRIDRLDTKFTSLFYYILVSNSIVDRAVKASLGSKKSFNERKFAEEMDKFEACEEDFFETFQI